MYERQFDRESAYERISGERLIEQRQEEDAKMAQEREKEQIRLEKEQVRLEKEREREYRRIASSSGRRGSSKSTLDKALGSAATSIGRSVGTQIVRGILGTIFKR